MNDTILALFVTFNVLSAAAGGFTCGVAAFSLVRGYENLPDLLRSYVEFALQLETGWLL